MTSYQSIHVVVAIMVVVAASLKGLAIDTFLESCCFQEATTIETYFRNRLAHCRVVNSAFSPRYYLASGYLIVQVVR